MRRVELILWMAALSFPMLAQTPSRERPPRPSMRAEAAEIAARQTAEQLAAAKKVCERDIDVLRHVRAADRALTDPMQPANAVQKAYEEVDAAKALMPEFLVSQGLIRSQRELEAARRSPATADFAHLRAILREEAIGPASSVVVRNALRLEEEALAWLKVQQLIADNLRVISEISSQSLRASEQ